MKIRFSLSILVALFLAALPCLADRDEGKPRQPENRFLFVVDTSSAMRSYSNEIAQAVGDLMESNMRGEFRKDDTIGLWTYSDKLNPEFPMQVWSDHDKEAITSQMTGFLEGQTYEKQAHWDKVMPALRQVIKRSDRITVILIFDGSELIRGTPFDKQIDSLQKRYAPELRAAHVPFITVLAARQGSIFDYTINYPGQVAIPHTASPEIPLTNAPGVAVTAPVIKAPPPKPRPSRSLIMSAATNLVHIAPVTRPVVQRAVVAEKPQPVVPSNPPPVIVPPIAPPVIARQTPPPIKETPPPETTPAPVAPTIQTPPPSIPSPQNPPQSDSQLALFVIAFSLLIIAVVLVVFLIRRGRGGPQPSLISQSIDRPR